MSLSSPIHGVSNKVLDVPHFISQSNYTQKTIKIIGAHNGKMLLLRIIDNNELMLILGQVGLSKGLPQRVGRGIRVVTHRIKPLAGARNRNKHPLKLFSIILDPAFYY